MKGRALLPLLAVLLLPVAAAAQHDEHAGHHAAPAQAGAPAAHRVTRVLNTIPGFKGNMTFDQESGRLFLISYGPPANIKGPSILYELEPQKGRVLRQATMPFTGELPSPVFLDGVLYQGVHHESKIYKVDARPGDEFGKILGEIRVPTLLEIGYDTEQHVFRFPFLSFKGMTKTPDNRLLIHAQDLGELVFIDPATGRFTHRVPTIKGLAGIAAVPGPRGEPLVLGNTDPIQAEFDNEVRRFMFRAAHTGPPVARYGRKDLLWVLLDARTGEVLASLENLDSRAQAGSVTLLRHEPVEGTPYGRFVFFAVGEEGILQIEWTPERGT